MGNNKFDNVLDCVSTPQILSAICNNPNSFKNDFLFSLQYGLKKKEVPSEEEPLGAEGRIGRKKKTPAELAAEANADSDDDEFASKFSSLCCCMNFV